MRNVLLVRESRRLVSRALLWSLKSTVFGRPTFRDLSSARPLTSEEVEDEERSAKLWKTMNRAKPSRMIRPLQPLSRTSTRPLPAAAPVLVSTTTEVTMDDLESNEEADFAPTTLTYTGGVTMPITTRLHIVTPNEDAPSGIWPVFRIMDENGEFREPEYDEKPTKRRATPCFTPETLRDTMTYDLDALRSFLSEVYPSHEAEFESSALLRCAKHAYPDIKSNNTLLRAHRQMVRLRQMDDIMLNAQRQGRISFYMTCRGEEAIHMGAASALDLNDVILAQYREQGVLMWRGFSLDQFMNQCFSNDLDLGKGRQMPVHYGSRALNFHTISSPLGTQIPQAVGAAYRLKLAGKESVAVCFFGDGCASTIDFHSGLNFAATLKVPVVFFCRNNGYAISTPVTDQYAGDGVVARAPGYGVAAIRVDGNDVFAVHAAVREAKRYSLQNKAPVLIEAMTYRQGHHSTSDDSTRYRSRDEVEEFAERFDPLLRLGNFLKRHGWIPSLQHESTIRDEEKIAVLKAMESAERRPKPPLDDLFEDVYHEMPPHLRQQKEQLIAHLAKYPKKY